MSETIPAPWQAASASLRQMAGQGLLMPDLAFRLTSIRFAIPPLRTRREELYGQRNDNRRNSQLEALAKTQDDIDKLEASYTKAACGPLD